MKIISQQRIKSLAISPKRCVEWIGESFAMKAQAQLPAKISVHPADTDFFTSMPCLLPNPADTGVNFHRQYFGVKEVHRIEGAVPSLGSDLMLYDAKLSQDFAARLQDEGIFVTGFYYPVVPKGQARIRVQVSAGHTTEQLDRCIAAFVKIGKEMNVIK